MMLHRGLTTKMDLISTDNRVSSDGERGEDRGEARGTRLLNSLRKTLREVDLIHCVFVLSFSS